MTLSIRYLRLYLHLPSGERRAIGYLSRFGDLQKLARTILEKLATGQRKTA